ncbi:MAG: winged helix-turn-helix domain-containing protein [Magnetococcales bacterium]|nr:winged helix-turn-helix domain-containing protein [Magnetococcales bacterium]
MKDSVLVVEEDESSRIQLQNILQEAGYICWLASDVDNARLKLEEARPTIILLDWYQTGISGLDFLRYLRKKAYLLAVPVIMLSDRLIDSERISALETGADDFLDKPFSAGELIARIQAILRRIDNRFRGDIIEVAGLRIELLNYKVFAGPLSTQLNIGRMAFQLLVFLAVNPEKVFSRGDLVENVWGLDSNVNKRTVDVHIRYLRRDLATSGHDKHLQTVRGCGYRFSLKV